jgi:DNA-3-methyladenine glycosylase
MYKTGGHAYVYLCYGIHSLFNIVTSVEQNPHAILIRGIIPYTGVELMKTRVGKSIISKRSGTGPGNVSKLLGISTIHTGVTLCPISYSEKEIWLQDERLLVKEEQISVYNRIGIDYAEEDAFLPYRFCWNRAEI